MGLLLPGAWLLPNLAFGRRTFITTWAVNDSSKPFNNLGIILSPVLRFPEEQRKTIEQNFSEPLTSECSHRRVHLSSFR